jgi:hypothetical protein
MREEFTNTAAVSTQVAVYRLLRVTDVLGEYQALRENVEHLLNDF